MATLQARLAQGDQAAFAELYDAYANQVSHYLLVYIGCRNDVDDVLQETFVRLALMRHKLADVDDLDAYVITVARNEAARMMARNARRRAKQKPLDGAELFCCPPDRGDVRDAAETVAAALSRLSDDLREIVELKTYAGLTFRQIAAVTGLPQGTVATRYRSALAKMQSWISRQP
jgi:RNA polymerase sigma-70 factor (ECF subfamily)